MLTKAQIGPASSSSRHKGVPYAPGKTSQQPALELRAINSVADGKRQRFDRMIELVCLLANSPERGPVSHSPMLRLAATVRLRISIKFILHVRRSKSAFAANVHYCKAVMVQQRRPQNLEVPAPSIPQALMQKGQRWFRYAINRVERTHTFGKCNRPGRMMERPARPIRLLDVIANMAGEKILLVVLKEVEKETPIPTEPVHVPTGPPAGKAWVRVWTSWPVPPCGGRRAER